MKRKLKALIVLLVIVTGLIIWVIEGRNFYCGDKNRYVTVWKRLGGTCFIIPGRYYGLTQPSDNYIITSNGTFGIDLFWSDRLPNTLILNYSEGQCKIINQNKEKLKIIKYDSIVGKIIYKPGTTKKFEINNDADLITLCIKESYAMDKNGKPL